MASKTKFKQVSDVPEDIKLAALSNLGYLNDEEHVEQQVWGWINGAMEGMPGFPFSNGRDEARAERKAIRSFLRECEYWANEESDNV